MDRERLGNIIGVGLLCCRQATTYQMYKELVGDEREVRDSDRWEVEYSMLLGVREAKRMLLFTGQLNGDFIIPNCQEASQSVT